MTPSTTNPTLILIPGHWLGAWAWEDVNAELAAAGNRGIALTLPGLDPTDADRTRRTLDDQFHAILHAVRDSAQPVVLVAHSGANGPVTLMLDRHPELVHRVIWVDSGPIASGTAFAADYPEEAGPLALPPFEELGQQASLAGLDAHALARFRARAVAQPTGVLRERVELSNTARFDVPTTFVCTSLLSAQVQEMAHANHPMFAEVTRFKDVTYVDLETGHWPMWSRPAELAGIILSAATRQSS